MCQQNEQPSISAYVRNWREYDGSTSEKLRLVARNFLRRFTTRQNCCGNGGEPGC